MVTTRWRCWGQGSARTCGASPPRRASSLPARSRSNPSLTAASVLLGELLYRDADLAGAIQVYEQALASAPSQPQLIARLDAWRREAALHDRFSQKIETHFTILFEGPPDQPRAARVAEILEAAYWRIGGAIGAYPASVVQVVLYTRDQFRDITQSPAWAGGAYDGSIRVPVGGTHRRVRTAARPVARAHPCDRLQPCAARRAAVAERGARRAVRERRSVARATAGRARGPHPARASSRQSFDALSGPQAALAMRRARSPLNGFSIRADPPPCTTC